MKPIIGITIDNDNEKPQNYRLGIMNIGAVQRAGGIAVVLPHVVENIDAYLAMIDGVFFSGGSDVSPIMYNKNPGIKIGYVNIERDIFELELYKKCFERKIPMLGICRGSQLLNIASGGDIYQDINTEVENSICHRQGSTVYKHEYFHKVSIKKGTKLYEIFKTETLYTNSYHHQSVKTLGPDFRAVAYTDDGVIEAIEYVGDNFIIGIQWHPEIMYNVHEESMLIFKEFISKCNRG